MTTRHQRFVRAVLVFAMVLASATARAQETEAPPPARHWVAVQIGFQHWFGATFGVPSGVQTPALAASVIPIDWLEVQLGYTVSVVELPMPDANTSHVGFLTAGLM